MANEVAGERVVDGVERLAPNGINVIVVGAGIGGLNAALECWRKGCEVVVLEKAEKTSPVGDFFTIPPSGLTTLKDYPSMFADYHESVYDCTTHVYTPSGQAIHGQKPEWQEPGVKHSAPDVSISFLKRRPEYNKMQCDQLTRLGVPIHWGNTVDSVQEKEDVVIVRTISGQEYLGDVCIAASGLGNKIPGLVEGDVQVQDSGYAAARVAFPREVIKEGCPAASLLNDGTAAELWGNLRDVEELFPYLEKASRDWDPAAIDFIKHTPGKVVDWNLRWRDGVYQWTSDGGRLIRLGDAAHAFFPTAGNGAVQALEDGMSLAECLCIGGKENIQWATKIHNKLRFERVSILQQTGFLNREELHTVDIATIENDPSQAKIGFFKQGRWIWAHDAEKYARENYVECLASLQEGRPFANTNVPPGHVYQPWSLESEKGRMKAGIRSKLKQNGYWGTEEVAPEKYRRKDEKRYLGDIASVIRSTNASPHKLTFDVMFDNQVTYQKIKESGVLNKKIIAQLYKLKLEDVVRSMYWDAAMAYKATIVRPATSGGFGEMDTHGSQQHVPLMFIECPFGRQ